MRRLRRERDLSLDEVSLATGVAVPTISRVERGLLVPSIDVKKRLAKYYRLPADRLLSEPEALAS